MDTTKKETEASDGRYRQNTVEFWLREEGIQLPVYRFPESTEISC